jgi:hypothetical protein
VDIAPAPPRPLASGGIEVDAELPGEGLEYLSDPDDDDSLPQ